MGKSELLAYGGRPRETLKKTRLNSTYMESIISHGDTPIGAIEN